MKNWPFPQQQTKRPWWLPVFGGAMALFLVVAIPILLLMLTAFGIFLYAVASSLGWLGVAIDVFAVLTLAAVVVVGLRAA